MKQALRLLQIALLLGWGLSLHAQAPSYVADPDRIDFGVVKVGLSTAQSVYVFRSFGSLRVAPGVVAQSSNPDISASSNNNAFIVTPPTQPDSEGALFTVRFRPPTGGLHQGIISFSILVNSQPQVVAQTMVTGAGDAPFNLNPTSLTFAPVLVGSKSALTFRIMVAAQQQALDLVVQSSSPSVFSVTPSQFTGLPANQPGIVTVTFNPTVGGVVRGAITVAGGGSSQTVVVEGEGAAFLLPSSSLDLGGALPGCSAAKDFSIVTGGLFDFQIIPRVAGTPFSIEPATFSTDEPTVVRARFSPMSVGAAQSTFVVFARSAGKVIQQEELALTGAGVEVVADPTSLDFGSVPVGSGSSVRVVRVSSSPAEALSARYTASSDNPAFKVTNVSASGQVQIAFIPLTERGTSGTVTIQVASASDPNCAVSLPVAVQGSGGEALLTVSPTSLDFGTVLIGEDSQPGVVQLTNQATTQFTGTVSSDNAAFIVNPASQGTVAVSPGASVPISIVFRPSAPGAASGNITFDLSSLTSGDPNPINVVRQVTVRGVGSAANFSYRFVQAGAPTAITPGGTVNFPPTAAGATESVDFEIRNEGTVESQVTSITAPGAPFSATGLPTLPANIAPGAALTFRLGFAPTAFGAFDGTLDVNGVAFAVQGAGVLSGAEITGVSSTIPSNQQPRVEVHLSSNTPQAVQGTLTMTYTPASGLPPDPSVQLETGGSSVSFNVPAGSDTAVFPNNQTSVGFQSGTVAANFVFSASLQSGETDITPTPQPSSSGSVAGGPPTISTLTLESVTATGFTAVVSGFSPTREITQATFNFTGKSGIQVQPSTVTPGGIGDAFRNWFQSEPSREFGSMFTLTVPFTISGETNSIATVSATISNAQGASQAVSANLP